MTEDIIEETTFPEEEYEITVGPSRIHYGLVVISVGEGTYYIRAVEAEALGRSLIAAARQRFPND